VAKGSQIFSNTEKVEKLDTDEKTDRKTPKGTWGTRMGTSTSVSRGTHMDVAASCGSVIHAIRTAAGHKNGLK